MRSEEFVTSLRQLADWYEQHPALPIPYECESPMFVFLYGKTEEEVKAILREIGSFTKHFNEPSEGDFEARKSIGAITLKFHTRRDVVCRPRVVGTRVIPETVIPAKKRQVIPAREEEIIEWDCDPILQEHAQ